MITRIQSENFNGSNRRVMCDAARVLVVGPNGWGKSSLVQAAALALLGYIPGEKKTDGDIFHRHATDRTQPMSVEVLANGHIVSREWTPKGESISCSVQIDSKRQNKQSAAGALAVILGGMAVFDLPAFLDLSPARQLAMLLEYCGSDEEAYEKVVGEIAAAKEKISAARAKASHAQEAVTALAERLGAMPRPASPKAELLAERQNLTAEVAALTAKIESAIGDAARYQQATQKLDQMREALARHLTNEVVEDEVVAAERALGAAQEIMNNYMTQAAPPDISPDIEALLCAGCKEKADAAIRKAQRVSELRAKEHKEAAAALRNAENAAARRRGERNRWADERYHFVAEIARCEELLKTAPPTDDIDAQRELVKGTEVRRDAIADALGQAMAIDAVEAELALARDRAATADADLEVWKDKLAKATAARVIVLEQALPPFQRVLRALAGPGADIRVDEDGKGLDFGVERYAPPIWIPHTSLSGGEKVRFYAALTAAVLSIAGGAVRLAAIEAAEADSENLGTLLDSLAGAAGEGQQTFVLTCHNIERPETYDGWLVIDLTSASANGLTLEGRPA